MSMFRSQTDEQLAAKWDQWPYVLPENGTRWFIEDGVCWEQTHPEQQCEATNALKFAPRVECIPSRDPLPYADRKFSTRRFGAKWYAAQPGDLFFKPRPEFVRPPVNRILYDFRLWVEREGQASVLSWYLDKPWARGGRDEDGNWSVSDDEIEHARKVLTRLAALS